MTPEDAKRLFDVVSRLQQTKQEVELYEEELRHLWLELYPQEFEEQTNDR